MYNSAETQMMLMMTMQTINICGVVYIASKVFGFIKIVAKFMLREVERSGQEACGCKNDKLESL